jgi:hypothetical protein
MKIPKHRIRRGLLIIEDAQILLDEVQSGLLPVNCRSPKLDRVFDLLLDLKAILTKEKRCGKRL